MRKSLWIIFTVLFLAIGATNAHADTYIDYTINFMGPPGTVLPTEGTIVYDLTPGVLDPFSQFTVRWDGEFFDYTPAANQFNYLYGTHDPAYFDTSSGSCAGVTGYQPLIVIMVKCTGIWAAQADVANDTWGFSIEYHGRFPYFVDNECCTLPEPEVSTRPGFENGGGGLPFSITPSPTAVPEPGTGIPLLIGIGLVLMMRKRKTQRLSLTT